MSRAPGSYAGLTVAQADLLSFLRHSEAAGRSPSISEISSALGYYGKSNVHRMVVHLEKRGYITREPNQARSIVCSDYPRIAIKQVDTPSLVAELTSRGFRFYGLSGERA